MTTHLPQTWEYQLLSWAEEAFNTHSSRVAISADSTLLAAAYRHCNAITRFHSRTFFMASGLLPEDKRRAARALYAFCRITDNIVDSNKEVQERQAALTAWRKAISTDHPPESELVALAWADTQQRFNIPNGYAKQLIDGVGRDLSQTRYETFADLAEYSYGVASTVGLMAMHIVGFAGEHAIPYAVKLGVALQMTNILRDVAEDWRAGRVYLPQDELRAFDLTEESIAESAATGYVNGRWRAFLQFQIARTNNLYHEVWPGIALLDPNGRFAIAAAAELYQAILSNIEAHNYNVFSRRAQVSLSGKMARLPGIWQRSRRVQYHHIVP